MFMSGKVLESKALPLRAVKNIQNEVEVYFHLFLTSVQFGCEYICMQYMTWCHIFIITTLTIAARSLAEAYYDISGVY
jgi:hypothetical protein